jgi:hypothetical protein
MKCVIPPKDPNDETAKDWHCVGETNNADGVCDGCKAFGWTTDPKEIAEAIANDPDFAGRIDIVSPIQPEDL